MRNNDYVQPGGPENPLGARALYLFQNGRDTYFRIHGTTAPRSIGRSVSNGCIRMLNEHVRIFTSVCRSARSSPSCDTLAVRDASLA